METDAFLAAIGAQVRRVRVARGLSQERLAECAGIHRNYVGLIERGERNVTLGVVVDVAEALDITLAELFADLPRREPISTQAVGASPVDGEAA
ncbi:helix-turn-helix domain-containing protein [Sphingomonas sp. BK069]|uniref:helix-turn-helix domain-containing protein n=1 Tax=Sphingomonas sp. BK069 TaxID=2586979 RepID=UPI00161DDE7D|nr:helix-turn-helix transcriptional regulator [Sphingomonas sp. BK069]MBB3349824.1 transcriptional regulator with XRE-family HTH domain [Sphingomonas sp. BK069]